MVSKKIIGKVWKFKNIVLYLYHVKQLKTHTMQNIIFFISLAFMQPLASTVSQPIYAVEPNEPLSVNVTQIKRSRGKGRGQSPWFAKYF